ncbi:MAG TPA: hypothetical protein VMT17_18745 [Anaeromyxobacteraceae bacterium]|nr:hypothetical protein [Anaeromyxobacteraceae bacterium]
MPSVPSLSPGEAPLAGAAGPRPAAPGSDEGGLRPHLVIAAFLFIVTAAAVFAFQGDPLLSLVPLVVFGLAFLLWRTPLRYIAAALLFLSLALDADTNGVRDRWSYPLEPLRVLFFENLHKIIPISALKLSLLDLLVALVVALVVYRRAMARGTDGHGVRSVNWLRMVLLLALAGMIGALGWGVARGGVFQQAYWQLREPIYLPILALVFLACFKDSSDLRPIGAAVVGAAVYKSLVCIYFYQAVARQFNYRPPYVTSHTDSVLFSVAIMIALIAWHERLEIRTRMVLLAAVPVVLLGIYTNNRRLAWVELGVSLLVAYALTPWTFVKRTLARFAIIGSVFFLAYMVVGWNSTAGVFRPAQMVRSVVDAKVDRSSLDREVENYNLVITLRTNPLLGLGLGHEYVEFTKGDDISVAFPQYRFIPHNSVLGLVAFGGFLFFTLMWLPIVTGMYLAIRSYRLAPTPLTRAAALSVVTVLIAYELQGWGDMGIQAWSAVFLVGVALAVVGQLAPAVGAWPLRHRRARAPSWGASPAAATEAP